MTERPFADAALLYWSGGWAGTLPLGRRRKGPPPTGWTGAAGPDPSRADVQCWFEEPWAAEGNIGLRMPPGVVGVDVDHYGTKSGGDTLAELEAQLGPLPPTWRSSARPLPSGIRFYRVPEGLAWPGNFGQDIECIQRRHRYAVVWPSVHPDADGLYRWTWVDGTEAKAYGDDTLPAVDDLSFMPAAWVDHFTGGRAATDLPRAGLDQAGIAGWFGTGGGEPCAAVLTASMGGLEQLRDRTLARHEIGLAVTARLAHLHGEGHLGALRALADFRVAWMAATAPDRREAAASSEWTRMVNGAVQLAAAERPQPGVDGDPCHWVDLLMESVTTTAQLPPPAPTPPWEQQAAPAAPMAVEATQEPPEAVQPEQSRRSSWNRRPLRGGPKQAPPVVLTRSDGSKLLYPGKINNLLGHSESGKSWLALDAVAEVLRRGESAMMIDFEDSPAGVLPRLVALGLTEAQIDHLAYISPEDPLGPAELAALGEELTSARPSLILLDGVNAGMVLMGLKINDNDDAGRFDRALLRPLAATGAVVLTVDHLPKDREKETAGGIGAQNKRAMVTGCAIRVDVVKPFGRGQTGRLKLTVDKDRPGLVRAVALGARHLGEAILQSDAETGAVDIRIDAPNGGTTDDGIFRPTTVMQRVIEYLGTVDEATTSTIKECVSGKASVIVAAINALVHDGHLTVREGESKRGTPIRWYSIADTSSQVQGVPAGQEAVPSRSLAVPSFPGTASGGSAEGVPTSTLGAPAPGTRERLRSPDRQGFVEQSSSNPSPTPEAALDTSSYRSEPTPFAADYYSTCGECGDKIEPGDLIVMSDQGAIHLECQ